MEAFAHIVIAGPWECALALLQARTHTSEKTYQSLTMQGVDM